MTSYELDNLQRAIRDHFCKIYTLDGQALLCDHYTYLLPGLLGIKNKDALKILFETVHDSIHDSFCSDPLISSIINYLKESTRFDFTNLVFLKEFKHNFKAFIQSVQGERILIEVWIGASAIIAILSIFYAQYDDYIESYNSKKENIDEKAMFLAKKHLYIKRILIVWRSEGKITIDFNSNLYLPPHLSFKASRIFLEAFQFLIYHELGHHFLDHQQNTSEENLVKELEADSFAIYLADDAFNIGPLICYLAGSILTFDDSEIHSGNHSPIKIRANNYYDLLESISENKAMTKNWIDSNILPFQQILRNFDNRTGLPEWYNSALDLLESKINLARNSILSKDFHVNDIFNIYESAKPKPLINKIDIQFI